MKNYELLSELSHPGRLKILSMLRENPMRLSHISKKFDISTPEASRHLERLANARLIEKWVDGLYHISPFGNLLSSFMPMVDFLSKNVDYLSTHDLSPIPIEFIQRIGELSEAGFDRGAMHLFHSAEKVFGEAKEYIWIMTNQILTSSRSILQDQVTSGLEFRIIMPRDYKPPPDVQPVREVIHRRTLDEVKVTIILTEKDAGVVFPSLDGVIDYSVGIGGREPLVHKWIKDLFEYYWEKARPLEI
jgi:predicted transcriptional regulator